MSTTQTPVLPVIGRTGTIYNRIFWLSYTANVSLVTANALTFRFAEFVAYLGGSERIAGLVVSAGVTAALIARLVLGQAIDNYGTRRLWMLSSLLFVCGCGMFLASTELSWLLYAARAAFAVALAAMFTCSMVHIQNQVPADRRTEMIGSLGTSGFFGMITGTQLGDWIFRAFPSGREQFLALFGTAAALGLLYLMVVIVLTRNDSHQRPQETPAAHRLIFRYWPGSVVVVAMMMGIGFNVTTVFLTRFATALNLSGIGTFFSGFAVSAFVFRIVGRHWSRTIGRHRMILLGLTGQCLGLSMLPFVSREWHFVIPAVGCGFGHALLFPAVISLGAGAFPKQYRGSGTTIVLGFTEVGAMISAPLLGWIIDRYGFSQMFLGAGGTALMIGVFYALTSARKPDNDATDETTPPRTVSLPLREEDEPFDHEAGESVNIPFPHLGRTG